MNEIAIRVDHFRKLYGDFVAVNDISFLKARFGDGRYLTPG